MTEERYHTVPLTELWYRSFLHKSLTIHCNVSVADYIYLLSFLHLSDIL